MNLQVKKKGSEPRCAPCAPRLKFGTDLTEAAREGRLDPLVGRGPEMGDMRAYRLRMHGMEETKL